MSAIKLAAPIRLGDQEYAELDLSAPIALKLREAIRLGEVEYTELSLKEPSVGQLEAAGQAMNGTAANVTLISKVCGVPEAMVRQMKQGDYVQAVSFFDAVATAFRPTGATS